MFDSIKSLNSVFPSNHFYNCNFNYYEININNRNNEEDNSHHHTFKKRISRRINFHEIIREYIVPLIHNKIQREHNIETCVIIHIGTILFHSFEDGYIKKSTFKKYLEKEGTGYKKMETHQVKRFHGSIFTTSEMEDFENYDQQVYRIHAEKIKSVNNKDQKNHPEHKKEQTYYQFDLGIYYVISRCCDHNNDKKDVNMKKQCEFFALIDLQETLYFHWLDENQTNGLDLRISIVKKESIRDKKRIRNYISHYQSNPLFRKWKEVEINTSRNQNTNIPYFSYKIKYDENKEPMNELFLKSPLPSYDEKNPNHIPQWIKYLNQLFSFIVKMKEN